MAALVNGDRTNRADCQSRRRFLRRSLAIGTLGAAGGVAGCQDLLPGGEDIEYGPVDPPTAGERSPLLDFVPTPEAMGLDGFGRLETVEPPRFYAEPKTIEGTAFGAGLPSELAPIRGWQDSFGLGFDSYEAVLSVTGRFDLIVAAEFEMAAVIQTVSESGYERIGTNGAFEVFDRTDKPRAVAISDSHFVFVREQLGSDHPDRLALLDGIVGAYAGEGERAAADNPLVEQVGRRPYAAYLTWENWLTSLRPIPAKAWSFDDDTAYLLYTLAYEENPPDRSSIETSLEGDRDDSMQWGTYPEQAETVDVTVGDSTVAVEMAFTADQFKALQADHDSPPAITWGFEYDEPTFTVHHEMGQSIPVRQIRVVPERFDDLALRVDGDSALFEQGDTATIEFEDEPAFLRFEYEPSASSQTNFFEYQF